MNEKKDEFCCVLFSERDLPEKTIGRLIITARRMVREKSHCHILESLKEVITIRTDFERVMFGNEIGVRFYAEIEGKESCLVEYTIDTRATDVNFAHYVISPGEAGAMFGNN